MIMRSSEQHFSPFILVKGAICRKRTKTSSTLRCSSCSRSRRVGVDYAKRSPSLYFYIFAFAACRPCCYPTSCRQRRPILSSAITLRQDAGSWREHVQSLQHLDHQEAIRQFTRAMIDSVGNLEPSLDVYPDQFAPIVRNTAAGRELAMVRWGLPNSSQAIFQAAAKRADKLLAKGKDVDFDELLKMGRTAAPQTSATRRAGTGPDGSGSSSAASCRSRALPNRIRQTR